MQVVKHEKRLFARKLTRQERRFLISPAAHISVVARLHGKISKDALKTAVGKMLKTYPLLACRIEWDGEEALATTDGAAQVPVKIYERDAENTWKHVLNKEHSIPVKPSEGPLTRCILVKGKEVSELIVFIHHAISDGRSLEFALREILLHLGDPNREPPLMREVPPQTPEIFPEGVSQGRIKSWAIGQLNKKWIKEEVQFDEEDLGNIWEAFWKNSNYQIETITFTKEETEKLIQICRHHEVTINSALQIAFIKAREETIGPYDKKVKMGTAVDSRERLRAEIDDAVGLYAGGIIFHFDYKREADIWDNVRKYHHVVHKNLKDNKIFAPIIDQISIKPTLYDALLFATLGNQVEPHQSRYRKLSEFASRKTGMVASYLKKFDKNIPNVMSTNLGRLSIPSDVDGIEIERVFFTPSSGLKLEIVTGVATANGKLTVTLNYHSGYFDGTQLRKVRDRAEEILKGLIEA